MSQHTPPAGAQAIRAVKTKNKERLLELHVRFQTARREQDQNELALRHKEFAGLPLVPTAIKALLVKDGSQDLIIKKMKRIRQERSKRFAAVVKAWDADQDFEREIWAEDGAEEAGDQPENSDDGNDEPTEPLSAQSIGRMAIDEDADQVLVNASIASPSETTGQTQEVFVTVFPEETDPAVALSKLIRRCQARGIEVQDRALLSLLQGA